MYGLAGHAYAPGIPRSGARRKQLRGRLAKDISNKPKYDKANKANARRLAMSKAARNG